MNSYLIHILVFLLSYQSLMAQEKADEIIQYKNPIIALDYSDPDVLRVGKDYYMTASSFNCVPGLPILHSTDLINWTLINYAIDSLIPYDHFTKVQHGNGVWAPAIRFHNNHFYIYYGDPDFGIFMLKADDPAGKWSKPLLVKKAKGWIDPCPFWDDDGSAYLVHAFAGSRAGLKSILVLHKMAADGSSLLDDGILVFDGHDKHPTIEGSKMYKRNGYYYIFAPAGGVATGWQTILRSKNIYGPYEDKVVLEQGSTAINGPHQGAWIEGGNNDYFIHFQEKQPFGRIVHMQEVKWIDEWPEMGMDLDKNGYGEPLSGYKSPLGIKQKNVLLKINSDDFDSPKLGHQWQWQANPEPEWLFTSNLGFLRLNPVITDSLSNLWSAPNLLLQKMPAKSFSVSCKLEFHGHFDGEKSGLIIMGRDYSHISIQKMDGQLYIVQSECINAENGQQERIVEEIQIDHKEVILKVEVSDNGKCKFSYSERGKHFKGIGQAFQAREGKWIGAKIGLFSSRYKHENNGGYTNVDWFRLE